MVFASKADLSKLLDLFKVEDVSSLLQKASSGQKWLEPELDAIQ